jgi:hypothetical protein
MQIPQFDPGATALMRPQLRQLLAKANVSLDCLNSSYVCRNLRQDSRYPIGMESIWFRSAPCVSRFESLGAPDISRGADRG